MDVYRSGTKHLFASPLEKINVKDSVWKIKGHFNRLIWLLTLASFLSAVSFFMLVMLVYRQTGWQRHLLAPNLTYTDEFVHVLGALTEPDVKEQFIAWSTGKKLHARTICFTTKC